MPSFYLPHSLASEALSRFYEANVSPYGDSVVDFPGFQSRCIANILNRLSEFLSQPEGASLVAGVITSYDVYIQHRCPAYQLLYPVVSFLHVLHAAMLTTSDTDLLQNMLAVFLTPITDRPSMECV